MFTRLLLFINFFLSLASFSLHLECIDSATNTLFSVNQTRVVMKINILETYYTLTATEATENGAFLSGTGFSIHYVQNNGVTQATFSGVVAQQTVEYRFITCWNLERETSSYLATPAPTILDETYSKNPQITNFVDSSIYSIKYPSITVCRHFNESFRLSLDKEYAFLSREGALKALISSSYGQQQTISIHENTPIWQKINNFELPASSQNYVSVEFSPDNSQLLIKILKDSRNQYMVVDLHAVEFNEIDFYIITLKNGVTRKIEYPGIVNSATFSPDGNHIVIGCNDGGIHLLDANTFEPIISYIGHSAKIYTVRLSDNNEILISAAADNTVRYWDIQSGEPINLLKWNSAGCSFAVIREDGKSLLGNKKENIFYIWPLPERLPRRTKAAKSSEY